MVAVWPSPVAPIRGDIEDTSDASVKNPLSDISPMTAAPAVTGA